MIKQTKVLLVEANSADVKLIVELLAEDDTVAFNIIHAESLSQAIQVLSAQDIDIILLDLNLPDSLGFETFNTIYQLTTDIPIIAMAESGETELSRATINAGAQDYLVKDTLDSAILKRVIKDTIERINLNLTIKDLDFMVENSDRAIYTCDLNGKIIKWNKGAEKIYGYNREDILNKNISLLFADDEQINHQIIINDIYKGRFNVNFESKHIRKDGKDLIVLMKAACIIKSHGKPSGVAYIVTDETNRRINEKLLAVQYRVTTILHESKDLPQAFRTVIITICEILEWEAGEIWLLNESEVTLNVASAWARNDKQGDFSSVNKDITLHLNEGIVGHIWAKRDACWIKDVTNESSSKNDIQFLQAGLKCALGYPILLHGKILGVIIFYSPVIHKPTDAFNANMKVICDLIAASVNRCQIEENASLLQSQLYIKNKELESQMTFLNQANHAKSTFIANMSHELRTPLNTIIGFSELVYKNKVGTMLETQQECMEEVVKSAHHLLNLVDQILDLSRIDSGKMRCILSPTNISQLINDVCMSMKLEAAKKKVSISFDYNAVSLDNVVTDSDKIKQILINYLSNAIKFTPMGGNIAVNVCIEENAFFRISVTDTGIGINKDDISKLFIEFGQLNISYSKTQQGIGLGLALSKHLAELLGGNVGVTSEQGKGSTFFVTLPLTSANTQNIDHTKM